MSRAPPATTVIAVSADGSVKIDGDKPQALKLAAKQRDRVSVPVAGRRAPARARSR